jgi:hypothetical protein
MKISKATGSIVKAVILIGIAYGILNWQEVNLTDDGAKDFAEKACISEITRRFNVTTVRAYAINENSNGYVVRATVTLAKGNTAKVNCLTNVHGGVRDISIEER